jgi:transposase
VRKSWAGGRYGTDAAGYASMLAGVRRWPQRTWAIEGCQGIGRHLAARLVAAGEQVVDVPPKLSARTRVFTAGQGRKTDVTDGHSIALAATRSSGLRQVTGNEQLEILRILADRRKSLGEDHSRMISQLHRLLLELIPGGAKKALSAAQAKALLTRVRPRDPAGQARRRVAAELISDLERICQRKKAADKELTAALKATGTTLSTLDGIGPSGAARLLGRGRRHHPGSPAGRILPPGTAPRRSTHPPATTSGTARPARETGRSTASCTSWP